MVGAEQRVVIDQQPSEDTLNKLNFHENQAEVTEPFVEHDGNPQTATFGAPNDADFEGVEAIRPGGRVEDQFSEDEWVYNPVDHRPYVVVDRDPLTPGVQKIWRQTVFRDVLPNFTDYIGEFPDDATAGAHVTAIRASNRTGSLYFDTTLEELKEALTVTAGSARVVGHIFRRLLTSQDFERLDLRVKSNSQSVEAHTQQLSSARSGLTDEQSVRAQADVITAQAVSSASAYQTALNNQRGAAGGLVVHVDTDISGTRDGANYSWSAGQILYVPPLSDAVHPWFIIGQATSSGGGSGTSIAKVLTTEVDTVRNQTNQLDLAGIAQTARNALNDSKYMSLRMTARFLQRILKLATTSTA